MLADAIRSEAYRVGRNRMTVFWSVLFVPVMALVVSIIVNVATKARTAELAAKLPAELSRPGGPLDLGMSLAETAADLANSGLLLFLLIGAATLYAGDYRWESWRLTRPRNTRPNLILGKVLVMIGLAALGMIAWMVAGTLADVGKAVVFEQALTFSVNAAIAADVAEFSSLALIRIMQFTMMSLLAAVFTRSLLAALFVPIVVLVGQSLLMQALPLFKLQPGDWTAQLLSPGLAHDMIKALIQGGPAATVVPDGVAIKAWTSLVLWTLVPLAGAIAWFQRQDLSKE